MIPAPYSLFTFSWEAFTAWYTHSGLNSLKLSCVVKTSHHHHFEQRQTGGNQLGLFAWYLLINNQQRSCPNKILHGSGHLHVSVWKGRRRKNCKCEGSSPSLARLKSTFSFSVVANLAFLQQCLHERLKFVSWGQQVLVRLQPEESQPRKELQNLEEQKRKNPTDPHDKLAWSLFASKQEKYLHKRKQNKKRQKA